MNGIRFEDASPAGTVDPGRADIACFVGLVRSAGIAIPAGVRAWFSVQGLLRYPFAAPSGRPLPPLPDAVRAWFLAQGWIAALASSAAVPDAAVLGTLAVPARDADASLRLAAPLADDAPLFARVGGEIVAVAGVDATREVLAVTRGVAATVAAAHPAGARVTAGDVDPIAQLGVQLARTLPAAVRDWLKANGWLSGPLARDVDSALDVPVPLESYAAFTAMFVPADVDPDAAYLAAAVASFFAQGGKRCYVVRTGDPAGAADGASARAEKLASVLVDDAHDAGDPSTWHGAGHLAGLPEVSFLAVPDLPMLIASPAPAIAELVPSAPAQTPAFAECSSLDAAVAESRASSAPAPRCSPRDYGRWADAAGTLLAYLASGPARHEPHLREVQLVAALPLPQAAAASSAPGLDAAAALARDVQDALAAYLPQAAEPFGGIAARNVSSAFLQLAYPWLRTAWSAALPEGLEPPDGVLTGMLARNALTRGAFAAATKVAPAGVADLWPPLPAHETRRASSPLAWDGTPKPLVERVSCFGFTPDGVRLLSDVTAYPGEAYRDASVNRLVSVICRAARRFGEAVVFGSNGPALWGRTRAFLTSLMTQLWSMNAFDGATVFDAFSVRCDASTMTQNDLDNGVLVADVTFAAASKVERIRVTLAFEAGAAPQTAAFAQAG